VTIATYAAFDQYLRVTSNNAAVLPYLSSGVQVPGGSTRGFVQILPASVATTTVVRIWVTGGGVTRFADLTVNPSGTPPPAATLSSLIVPSSVTAATRPSDGQAGERCASGGLAVTLEATSRAASVPATVTVPAGAISANFTITTFPKRGHDVQLSARLGDTILFAALGVTAGSPPPPPPRGNTVAHQPGQRATVTLPATLDWSDVSAPRPT
jgi:hypothetical protein